MSFRTQMLQIENTPDLVNLGNRGHLESLKVVEGQNLMVTVVHMIC